MRRCIALAFVLAVAKSASAREPSDDEYVAAVNAPTKGTAHAWYGYQTFLADAAYIAIFATVPAWPGVGEGGAFVLTCDALAFVATAPGIHALHDDPQAAWIVALNGGTTIAGAFVGFGIGLAAAPPCACPSNPLFSLPCACGVASGGWGAYAGTIAGASLAAILDAALFARETPDAARASSRVSWHVSPLAFQSGAGVGVAGTF